MSSLRARWTLLSLLLSAAAALPAPAAEAPALATSPSSTAAAQAHFQRGIERYDEAEYPLALVEFQRAYALQPSYQLLFNIGQVHYQLRQYARARGALEEYLARGGDQVASERRAQVEQQLAQLRSRTAELHITVNVPGADISLNDELIGASPLAAATFVDVGTQRIMASTPGYSSARSSVAVTGGEIAQVGLTLQELVREAPTTANLPATLAWVGAGALTAGALGTGLATLFASRRYTELRKEPLSGAPDAARGRLDEQQSRVSTLATTTDILAGASLAAASLALYFTLREPTTDVPHIQARIGPAGLYTWVEF